jgi:hypothetical protein
LQDDVSCLAVDEVACALLDRIAASPGGGDADHLVLADHLIQTGQPTWGELIALACAEARGALTRASRHRLFLLRGDPGPWLGPVKPVTFRRELDRGLLVATGIDGRRHGMVAASVGHIAWRTVREVQLHDHAWWAVHPRAADEIAAVLRGLPALASLRGVSMNIVLALGGAAPLPIRSLELFMPRHADPMDREGHEALGGPAFEGVRHLVLDHGAFRDRGFDPAELAWWLAAAPITRNVETLYLGFLPLEPWRGAVALHARPALRTCRAYHRAGHFELVRDASGQFRHLSVSARYGTGFSAPRQLDTLEAELAQLAPASLTQLRLVVTPSMRAEAELRLARLAARQPGAALELITASPDEAAR